MNQLTIRKPDDFHIHLRDAHALKYTVPPVAKRFGKAIVMPNLLPPVCNVADALAYKTRIEAAMPSNEQFQPLMALYLTADTTINEIEQAALNDAVIGYKLYPQGVTTHSQAGVKDFDSLYPLFEAMARVDIPLMIHGESPEHDVDIFDREKNFIDCHLSKLRQRIPELRIALEHISSHQGVDFVLANDNIVATITAHHLKINRNHMLSGGIQPHHYCLPVAKREHHRQALVAAATSGNAKFIFGSDSAPHAKLAKESSCGCAGIYTTPMNIELVTEIFEQHHALDQLEKFLALNGAKFYGLPFNNETITLVKQSMRVPKSYPYHQDVLIPFLANETISWQIKTSP